MLIAAKVENLALDELERACAENKSTPRVAASLSAEPLLAVQQQPRVTEFTY